MPRKARTYDKHVPLPDPKFGSVKYAKFINYLMERGKKSVAQHIFYTALEIVGEKAKAAEVKPEKAPADLKSEPKKDEKIETKAEAKVETKASPVESTADNQPKDSRAIFDLALKNVSPIMEIKGRRIGGSNYQIPMEVQEPRKTTLGMKWLIAAARARKGMPMAQKLAAEILDAFNRQGAAVKKREDTHRMADANKAFAHFARFNRNRR
jgi:small subunit ribosomal protein S7